MTAPAPPQQSRYSLGSAKNLVYSLLAVLGMTAVLVLMVPRVSSVSGPPVDVHASAVAVTDETGWPVVEPVGLPDGWSPTSVRYVRTTGDAMTWHVGYQTPSGTFVAVEQTQDASDEWVAAQTNRAPSEGTMEVAGLTWTKLVRDNKVQNSLLNRPEAAGELTTLITGTAGFDDMALFIEHLEPAVG